VIGICIFLSIVIGCGFLCAQSVSGFIHNIDIYEDEAIRIYNVTQIWLEKHNIDIHDVDIHGLAQSLASSAAEDVLLWLAQFMGSLALVVIFAMYMLCGKHQFPEGSVRKQVDSHIQQYIFFKTLVSAMVGSLVSLCFFIMKADLAFFWGFCTFFANWIPNIGAMIATLFPLPVIALDPNQTFMGSRIGAVIFALVGPMIMHQIVGNYVEPRLFGKKFEMHPVTVLCALVFWGLLWGISGGILSVPLTAAIHIGLKDLDHPFAKSACCMIEGKLDNVHKHMNHRRESKEDHTSQENPIGELSQDTERRRMTFS